MPYSYPDFKEDIKKYIYNKYDKNIKILDVGPGLGTYSILLSDYKNIDAVEIYEPYVEKYNLKDKYNNVFISNIIDFDFDFYDIIIMGDLIEHLSVKDSQKLLEKIYDKCNEIIVCVPFLLKQFGLENKHEDHIQDDLTPTIMEKRYKNLKPMWENNRIGVYFKNKTKNNFLKNGISIVMAYHNRRSQLIKTLKSINNTNYNKNNLQIIIVNDNSSNEHEIDDLKDIFVDLDLFILNIKEKQKTWINSCVPYNIGFNHIKYDKVIIQNPECYHQGDVIKDVSENLTNELYLSYACYSLTHENSKLNDFNDVQIKNEKYTQALSDGWYNHSIYRPSFFHFCSAISYNNLCKINGFDERYKDGIGFDDNEIIERIKYLGLDLKVVDNPFVFHQAHSSIFHFNDNTSEEDKNLKLKRFYKNQDIFDNITKKEKNYKAEHNTFF